MFAHRWQALGDTFRIVHNSSKLEWTDIVQSRAKRSRQAPAAWHLARQPTRNTE